MSALVFPEGIEKLAQFRSHDGWQYVLRHASRATGTAMQFAAYVPDHAAGTRLPVVWYLSGLTCTHANVMEKGEYRRICSELGMIFIAPDTSPRGEGVADAPDAAYDLGLGAGFYVDATQAPWASHYQMRRYIAEELPALVVECLPIAAGKQAIMGHSMGGHGALTIALNAPERFASVSAFAPIVAPTQVAWGQKAFSAYLGEDRAAWQAYDAVALIAHGARVPDILVDQGLEDGFLQEQLRPELLAQICQAKGQPLTLRMQEGYDHSYYFISTFMEDHLRWHYRHMMAAMA